MAIVRFKGYGEVEVPVGSSILEAAQNLHRTARRFLAGLEDDRAAGGNGRRYLADDVDRGKVPGAEGSDRADRLVQHHRSHSAGPLQHAAIDAHRLAGMEFEHAGSGQHLAFGLCKRLAFLGSDNERDMLGTFA